MGVVNDAVRGVGRMVGRTAVMTTEAAGAVGGAAINGIVGGVTGAAAGIQRGIGSGSHSVPAAALTLGALGAAGLVEWPVLLTVGGAALVLRQLNQSRNGAAVPAKAPAPQVAQKATKPANTQPRQQSPAKPAPARRARTGQSRNSR